jgi:hypothetical protein
MSNANKSTKKAATATKVETPAPVVAATTTTAAKTSKKATEKVAPVQAAAPVVQTPVQNTVTESQEEDISAVLQKTISELHEQLNNIKSAISTAANTIKSIEKQAGRVIKKADRKRRNRTVAADGTKKPCEFSKLTKITDELCAFLGKPKGSESTRSDVTKAVIGYAKSHNLMDKQAIKADAALRKLLAVTENDAVTILNLQKFLKRHYIKPAPVAK